MTVPLGPVEPCVLTLIGPDGGAGRLSFGSLAALGYWPLKMTAGPYRAVVPSGLLPLIVPPADGSVTDGLSDSSAV